MASALDLALQGAFDKHQSPPQDLMDLLTQEFLANHKSKNKPALAFFREFVAFAKDYLNQNPPVSQFYAGNGLGLTLQNGVGIFFNSQAHLEETSYSGVSITKSQGVPGQAMPKAESIPLTGNKK
jgi:hypothetical protein